MGRNEGFCSLIVIIYDSTLSNYLLLATASDFLVQNREYEEIYNSLIQRNCNLVLYIRTVGWPF